MSYCVHCGVELAPDLKKCPLCGTEVHDPNPPAIVDSRYVDHIVTNDKHINRHFFVTLANIIGSIPIIVTIIIDLCISKSLSWSLYVLGAELVIWIMVILPIRYSFKCVYLYLLADYIITSLFILLVYYLIKGNGWYLNFALPLNTLVWLGVLLITFVAVKKVPKITLASFIIFVISLIPIFIDVCLKLYEKVDLYPSWSLWAFIPLFVISISFLIISLNRKTSDWVRKNLFI